MKSVNVKTPLQKGTGMVLNGCLGETTSFRHAQKNSSAIRHQNQWGSPVLEMRSSIFECIEEERNLDVGDRMVARQIYGSVPSLRTSHIVVAQGVENTRGRSLSQLSHIRCLLPHPRRAGLVQNIVHCAATIGRTCRIAKGAPGTTPHPRCRSYPSASQASKKGNGAITPTGP
jgi:hypothetical protein